MSDQRRRGGGREAGRPLGRAAFSLLAAVKVLFPRPANTESYAGRWQDRESNTFQRLGTSRLCAQRADVIPVPRHGALDAFPKIDF